MPQELQCSWRHLPFFKLLKPKFTWHGNGYIPRDFTGGNRVTTNQSKQKTIISIIEITLLIMFCKTLAWRGRSLQILLVVKIIFFYLDQPCPALSIFKEVSKCNYANSCWLCLGGRRCFLPSLQHFPQPFPTNAVVRSALPFYVLQPTVLGMKRCPLIRSPEILNGFKCFCSWHWKLEFFYLHSRCCWQ